MGSRWRYQNPGTFRRGLCRARLGHRAGGVNPSSDAASDQINVEVKDSPVQVVIVVDPQYQRIAGLRRQDAIDPGVDDVQRSFVGPVPHFTRQPNDPSGFA